MTAATASAKAEFQQDNADLFSAGYRRATECSSHPFPGVLLAKHNIKKIHLAVMLKSQSQQLSRASMCPKALSSRNAQSSWGLTFLSALPMLSDGQQVTFCAPSQVLSVVLYRPIPEESPLSTPKQPDFAESLRL